MNTYQKCKNHILKYQKTSAKYKAYKKEYDEVYRKKFPVYHKFRVMKNIYYKKYSKDLARKKLRNWLMKQKVCGNEFARCMSQMEYIGVK